MRHLLLAGLGILPILAGCEASFLSGGAQPEQPQWVHRPSGSLSVVYQVPLVAPIRQFGEAYQRGGVEVDRLGMRVFVGSSDNGLYSLEAKSGRTLWRFETTGAVQSAPLYDPNDNAVYFGSNDGALYKIAANNGQFIYRFETNSEVAERPVLSKGILYFVNANDTVLAIDPKSGKLRWSQHRTPAAGMEIAGYSGPLVWRDKVYLGFSDGVVMAYDAETGAERWQPVDLASEAEQVVGDVPKYLDVDTTPVPDMLEGGPAVYVASIQGGVFALDAETGAQVWSNSLASGVTSLMLWQQPSHLRASGPPALPARKILIAASGTTGLWGLEPENGTVLWRSRLPQGGVYGPQAFGGALLVTASQLGVFLINPLDGRVIDGIHSTDGISAQAGVAGARAFILTNGGKLLALHLTRPVDSWEPSSPDVFGRPADSSRHW
jgi:outer membrane protein assembly factor BamB